jgi:intein/homing endonuclease
MFPTHKRIVLLHLNGQIIRTTADHPFFIQGQGWVNAGDLPGAKSDGEQVLYHLNLGEQTMPDQPRPNHPILGFAAGTPLLTADGPKRIEDIKPGDLIQTQPDDDQGDHEPEAHGDDGDRLPQDPRWWERN